MMKALDGKWKVKGKSGWLKALVGDYKFISGDVGYNRWGEFKLWERIKWRGIKWGLFHIVEIEDYFRLVYLKGGIFDDIRFVGPDKLEGKFFKHKKYLGDFTMERVNTNVKDILGGHQSKERGGSSSVPEETEEEDQEIEISG